MEILAIVIGCAVLVFTAAFIAVLGVFMLHLKKHGGIKITTHKILETVQPPTTPMDEEAKKEYEEFLKEQKAFANDTIQKVQALFIDPVEEKDDDK